MRAEIRDLLAGDYLIDDEIMGEVGLEIYRDDDGIHIVNVDYELDVYYSWCLNEKGEIVTFDWGYISETQEHE